MHCAWQSLTAVIAQLYVIVDAHCTGNTTDVLCVASSHVECTWVSSLLQVAHPQDADGDTASKSTNGFDR